MSTYPCPKGHASTEPDYCSECGARLESNLTPPPPAPTAQLCPDCATPREPGVDFCEICGYNFETGVRGGIPVVPSAPIVPSAPLVPIVPSAPSPNTPIALPAVTPPQAPAQAPVWSLSITVDPTPHQPGSPAPPADFAPSTMTLDTATTLIGRRSEARALYPELPLNHDDAVSHRHALLQLTPEGTLLLRDLGSANGTSLNGRELPPLTDQPLQDADQITLGHWTRLTLKAGRA